MALEWKQTVTSYDNNSVQKVMMYELVDVDLHGDDRKYLASVHLGDDHFTARCRHLNGVREFQYLYEAKQWCLEEVEYLLYGEMLPNLPDPEEGLARRKRVQQRYV